MKLFYRKMGEGPPVIILHGLYGSSDNWVSIARELSDSYTIYIPDQRNHGKSPHSIHHDYNAMTADLEELIHDIIKDKVALLGHSMGGKVAVNFAMRNPDRVASLIVADISPFSRYPDDLAIIESHEKILKTLLYTDLSGAASRKDAEDIVMEKIPDKRVTSFLLKNITRDKSGKFKWKLNASALNNNIDKLMAGLTISEDVSEEVTGFPVLFIRGGESEYLPESHQKDISGLFPAAEYITISDTGHWLHADKPVEFTAIVRDFLAGTY
jgi:esterase